MGNLVNASAIFQQNIDVPGPRINAIFIDKEKIKQNDKNLLWLEQQQSQQRLKLIQDMVSQNEIKGDEPLKTIQTSRSKQEQYKTPGYNEQLVVNGKEVSQNLVYTIIGKRFHTCLNEHAEKEEEFKDLSNKDLIHQVCRKERLTFYNYLRLNTIDGKDITDESIKAMINREYMLYFKRNEIADIYSSDSKFEIPSINNLNKRFNISYQ